MESTKIHAFWNSGIHLCTDPIRCHGQQQIRSCLKSDSRIGWVLVLVVLHYGLHGYRPLDNTATMAGYLATYHTDFSPDLHSVLCILNLEEIKGAYLEPRCHTLSHWNKTGTTLHHTRASPISIPL